ncbi:ABC transporter ATP-binding protein [Dactylosporangium roseum]|uniref:ABC transporter ATP-binding protein n=1 Tax=Dactylosporangium roseum TaxID=47989 RepID=A0ABY5YXT7_9ACTN|nr:ABC transporter ATP-binding protein [Dactylosporangium roseum]UWZ34565.1 ABC transporter ATP-binding protein [Dactylosporangium roseum]
MQLELQGMTKRFGDVYANRDIDLTLRSGEIHALLGENGAGKSTLMNVLYGLYQPDGGQILIDGVEQHFTGPRDAIAAGIGMVHQHFMLIPVFTVAENVILGSEPTRGPFGALARARARQRVKDLSERYGLAVDPDALVSALPVGIRQRVEILKALARDAQVLVLDEPTAVLTPREIDDLMGIMQSLRAADKAIVFISHKLREVRAVADRVTVIRNGSVVGELPPGSEISELARMMVGRQVELAVTKGPARVGGEVLAVRSLSVEDEDGRLVVDDVSFEVRAGEVLALAGVQGNGQEHVVEAVMGLCQPTAGSVRLAGVDLTGATPQTMLRSGTGYVPEDRHLDGIVAPFSVAENLILDLHRDPPFRRGINLQPSSIKANAVHRVEEFDIRTPSIESPVGTLSGGNQQKVVIARQMSRELKLLIASQPTRGVDVGGGEFIHRRILAARDDGTAVLLVSSELDEVLTLADRIAVMYRGRIIGVVPGGVSREEVGMMMAGITPESGVAS